MTEEDRDIPRDPASVLPFVCELEPHDESVELLPSQYQGSDAALDKYMERYST